MKTLLALVAAVAFSVPFMLISGKKMPMVKAAQERAFANKVATYTVDIKGLANDFAKALSELKDWKLEVTDVTANAIKCKITE